MLIEKDEIKNWLKVIGKDRYWLAEMCFVKKSAVDEWFTKRGTIPASKLALISQLMTQEEEKKQASPTNFSSKIILDIPTDDYRKLEKIALQKHETVTDIAVDVLVSYVAEEYQKLMGGKTNKSSSNDSYSRRLSSAG